MSDAVLEALRQHFPEMQAHLYQGNLMHYADLVEQCATQCGLSYDDVIGLRQQYKHALDSGKSTEEAVQILADAFGDRTAAEAFALLYNIRCVALELIVKIGVNALGADLQQHGGNFSQRFRVNGDIRDLRGALQRTLVDIGGVGDALAAQSVRRFEQSVSDFIRDQGIGPVMGV